jgi:hypothetical protein
MATPNPILALLDQVAPQAAVTPRPADAFDCALAANGCTEWVLPKYAIFRAPDGTLVGLCPRREQHAQLAKGDKEAATIVGRLTGLFRQANPNYQLGSKSRTKVVKVTA